MLQGKNISVQYGAQTAVHQVSFTLQPGQWLMLAGPNGAGKSTLIRAIAQTIPYTGRITLDGNDLRSLRPAERAKQIAVLSQHHSAQYGYTVEEIVQLGRYAHRKGFLSSKPDGEDPCVDDALSLTGLTEYRRRSVLTLSGGELQRVFLAQVFAQNPKVLLLDEPANHLDLPYQQHIFSLLSQWLHLKYQQHILDLVARWLCRPDRAVVSVVHDLGLAKKYGTHALLMHQGNCVAYGETDAVLTASNLQAVYGMDVYAWMQDLLSQWNA